MAVRAARVLLPLAAALALCLAAAGCGQETPEGTVYKFLGAVQSHDLPAMRSCVNPEALKRVSGGEGELARAWEGLYRMYLAAPVDWRMAFTGIRLETDYLDGERALVRIVSGRCGLYRRAGGAWRRKGEVDFAREDFVPLYLVRRDGAWYLEALDLYLIRALEEAASS